jgi:hypothetical protein
VPFGINVVLFDKKVVPFGQNVVPFGIPTGKLISTWAQVDPNDII